MQRLLAFFERFDWVLFFAVLGLIGLGCLLIYSIGISQEQTGSLRLEKQLLATGLGLAGSLFFLWTDYRHARSFSMIGYGVGALLLLGVVLFGARINGTAGWFQFGSCSFQPVEIAKLTLILYLAAFFHDERADS